MTKKQRARPIKALIGLAVGLSLIPVLGCDRFFSTTKTSEPASVTFAPAVPPPIPRTKPAHLVINLSTSEEERPLADGPESDVQTTLIPAGGAAIIDFKLQVPGDYVLVDHSIFRMDRGAVGILSAFWDPAPSIFHSNQSPSAGSGH